VNSILQGRLSWLSRSWLRRRACIKTIYSVLECTEMPVQTSSRRENETESTPNYLDQVV